MRFDLVYEVGNFYLPAVHTYEAGIIPGLSNRCKCKLDRANPGNDFAILYTYLINYELCITEEPRISTYKNDDLIAFTQGDYSRKEQFVVFI